MQVPQELLDFVADKHRRESLPARLHFSDKPFILEIMRFFNLKDSSNFDRERNHIRFARNGDGFVLLVDLNEENHGILQEEFDDIDHIGLTLVDLKNAQWLSI